MLYKCADRTSTSITKQYFSVNLHFHIILITKQWIPALRSALLCTRHAYPTSTFLPYTSTSLRQELSKHGTRPRRNGMVASTLGTLPRRPNPMHLAANEGRAHCQWYSQGRRVEEGN